MSVQSYQEFQVWNVAMDLATECSRISEMGSCPTPHAPRFPGPKAKRAWSVRRGALTWRNDERAKLSGIPGVECVNGLGYRVLPDQPDALTPHAPRSPPHAPRFPGPKAKRAWSVRRGVWGVDVEER